GTNRLTHKSNDEQFAQKQEEIRHFVQDRHPGGKKNHDSLIREEGVFGRGAEYFNIGANAVHVVCVSTHHDVGVSVDELDEFLQTPEAALQTTQQELGKFILCKHLYNTVHTVKLDQGAKRQRSCVIPEQQRGERKADFMESRHVIWLYRRPVVRGEGAGQGHLSQSRDKVGTPEEEEDVVELQGDQVFVVNGFSSVEGKKTLGVRTMTFHHTGGVVLDTDTG
uniref:Uncharacterized protein n=1 Tax=Anabas testudineus TaxID=64144 RepID=A0A3Q1IB33_ANATE